MVWTFSCVQSLRFGHGTHATVNVSFLLFFFFSRISEWCSYCSCTVAWIVTANVDFPLWTVIRALFTDPQIPLFSKFFIKNESHGTIHTFKKYFITVFSISAKISSIQTDPENEFVDEILKKKERKWKCNIQETWKDKSIVIYSKEVVSLIILGNTFYFYLYPLF